MTDWLNPNSVEQAKQASEALHSMQLISRVTREQIDGMAEFYHREFKRRAAVKPG